MNLLAYVFERFFVVCVLIILVMVGPAEGTKISQRQVQLSLLNRSINAQVVEAYDINFMLIEKITY